MIDEIKANSLLHPIARGVKKTVIFLWSQVGKKKQKRCNGIEKYKDLYVGERCFIVATGPSLSVEDLELIKSEISFSMNSIINLYEKTTYRPTYYLIQDGNVERRLRDKLIEIFDNHKASFIGIGDIPGFRAIINRQQAKYYKEKFEFYNLSVAYHIYDMCYSAPRKIPTKFSSDCAEYVYDGCSVTYSAIQLAIYMGFKKIYLLGCDTNYSGHADGSPSEEKGNDSDPVLAMINSYEVAKKYADAHNIKIYNATRGGMLEVFSRVNLDDVIREHI